MLYNNAAGIGKTSLMERWINHPVPSLTEASGGGGSSFFNI
jgi:hypothetical protein